MTGMRKPSRDADFRRRMFGELGKRVGDPPWRRTTLMLCLAALLSKRDGERALQELKDEGAVIAAPERLGGDSRTVWRLAEDRRTSRDRNNHHA